MWRLRWVRVYKKKKRRARRSTKHYREHKEAARALVHARLLALNVHYNYTYNRVAIRDQRRRWGSCSKKGNLNFNYRILFLPAHLADYIIVHELAHLGEFNHSPRFWALVAQVIPEHKKYRAELRAISL